MENHVISDSSERLPSLHYFDDLTEDLIAYIEKSPSPAVAADLARCLVSVLQKK